MAKHCDVCNQDYADELASCPHCASVNKAPLAGRSEDRTTHLADFHEADLGDAPKPTDSAIDFSLPPTSKPTTGDAGGAEPLSGTSSVSWSSLVEEPPGEEVKIDSPSDAELLVHEEPASPVAASAPHEELVGELAPEEPAHTPEIDSGVAEEGIDLAAEPPQLREQASDSAVDLGGAGAELVEEDSGATVQVTPEGESAVFVAELASDASHVDLASDSGVDLAEDAAVEVEAVEAAIDPSAAAAELSEEAVLDESAIDGDSSAVDLGASPSEGSEALAVEAVEVVDEPEAGEVVEEAVETFSGGEIDLQGLRVPAASDAGAASDSAVDLGSNADLSTLSPSEEGVEAVADSQLDLAGDEPVAVEGASDPSLESLLMGPSSEVPSIEEEAVAADEEGVVAEEPVSADALEEPVVSEDEVNELLASLEEPPVEGTLEGMLPEEAADIAEGEEAIAAAEEEQAVDITDDEEIVSQEEEERKPSKPVKQRSRIPALMGGTFLGLLIGAGGLIGARFGGFDVPALLGIGGKDKTPIKTAGPPVKTSSFESLAALVQNGDWEEAEKGGIEKLQANNAKEWLTLGEYHLGKYLKGTGNPTLEPAILALQNAAKMKNDRAIYDLAWIKELAGKLPEARAAYVEGAQTFQNDGAKKLPFEAAIDRVDLKIKSLKAAGAFLMPLPQRLEDRMAVLALLLIGFQPGGQPPADTQEAGVDFLKAAKLARDGKFADATPLLVKARALHDRRRFTRLRKAQNPLSDPAEDIFLLCCDELKMYWQMGNLLQEKKYLTDENNTPLKALAELERQANASAETIKTVKGKLKDIEGDDVPKKLDNLIAAKTKADLKAADLMTKLTEATEKNTELAGKLKTANKTLDDQDDALEIVGGENKTLKSDKISLTAMLKKIADDLATAKFLDLKGKPLAKFLDLEVKPNVGEAVKNVIDLAKLKDPKGTITRQGTTIAELRSSLNGRWKPEEMLPLWLLLLDENRNRAELTSQAKKDAERVTMDPVAPMARKAEAAVVQGLVLRNSEKFSDAKTVLEAARDALDKGEWLDRAAAALKEVSDPAAYYGRQAQEQYDRGRMDAALAVLARAAKVLPAKDQGKLSAQRSLIELDAARSRAKGALSPTDPLIVAARKDAADAVNAKLAAGHYAAGRIAEELGQVDAAIKSYRAALAARLAVDADGARYRVALARVLLLPRQARPGQPGEESGAEEAEKLVNEVLAAEKARPGSIPFDVLAEASAIKGRWNVALQKYVEGIRPMLPRRYGNGLAYLILNHPRLKRPDSLRIANPLEAEKHFAAGLNFYFDRNYANAEKAFLLTIENESQDARYFYFLGLSRLAQNKRRDAYDDFDQGALLEQLNRPSPSAVSESLERIQGSNRRIVNDFRKRQER